ncbi:alpha/beta-hydrolase [Melanomma pulvis-pyrius CBS 109.77]|uniref:Alpha/beta-hydrolase n=1 Tax=Melanomma pulvis-pyrius CBS 109.77 TaxID=1314802 RepID=A0A6A6X6F1_9PLEO|nr:alpha/beta-hydrolase [Melanomma pulvis-pyrius CBS 109.77]
MSTPTFFTHPTLNCNLLGKPSSSTIQYRGLQYATIPSRFQESLPLNTLLPNRTVQGVEVYDATNFGPSCPQKRGAQAWDLTLTGNDIVLEMEVGQGESERMDERGCLHVNVTVPKSVDGRGREEGPLPVFVWVHGGGLAMGSNSWPQYDLRNFVSRSVETGKPVISVAVNYRVGVLGFLASEELGADGNMGFKDLVLAMRWVKRHIGGFGGDPQNITAAGESAGGIALSTLLCAETGPDPLFERVVVMSGDVTLRKPRGRKWHEEMYAEQLKYLGLEKEKIGREERTKTLKEWDAEEMCQRLPLAQHFCGYVEGRWLRGEVTLGMLGDGGIGVHKPAWCREFVVGDTGHDGTILKARILDSPTALSRLHTLCATYLTASETHALLTAYKLPLSPAPISLTHQQSHSLLLLASELRFYLPALLVHQGWRDHFPAPKSNTQSPSTSKRVSRYHFHCLNPFTGSFHNLASHELDVGFLLLNLAPHLPSSAQEASRKMADHFLGFVNGEGWAGEGEVVAFTDRGVEVMKDNGRKGYDSVWREGRGEVLRKISEGKLWRVAEGWQGVREEDGERAGEEKIRGRL